MSQCTYLVCIIRNMQKLRNDMAKKSLLRHQLGLHGVNTARQLSNDLLLLVVPVLEGRIGISNTFMGQRRTSEGAGSVAVCTIGDLAVCEAGGSQKGHDFGGVVGLGGSKSKLSAATTGKRHMAERLQSGGECGCAWIVDGDGSRSGVGVIGGHVSVGKCRSGLIQLLVR